MKTALKLKDLVYFPKLNLTFEITKVNGVIATGINSRDNISKHGNKLGTINETKNIPLNKKLKHFRTMNNGANYYLAN
jgi:hypothetical protein